MNQEIVLAKRDVINVISTEVVEGKVIVTVNCNDYDDYKNLPPAVKHMSGILRKTGWNSDRYIAYYKTAQPGQLLNIIA